MILLINHKIPRIGMIWGIFCIFAAGNHGAVRGEAKLVWTVPSSDNKIHLYETMDYVADYWQKIVC